MKDRSFTELLEEVNYELGFKQNNSVPTVQDFDIPDFPMTDSLDHEILMHKNAHFSSSFHFMLQYYEKDGKGCMPDIDYSRILRLHSYEQETGRDLFSEILSESEKEMVEKARLTYQKLKEIYDLSANKLSPARLLADLILSEDYEADEEVAAVVGQGSTIVDSLISVLEKDDFSNPLFPGYSYAPSLVARCLGEIGDERAIPSLFLSLDRGDEELEIEAESALKKLGQAAKEFLLGQLQSEPFTRDNIRAASVLSSRFIGDADLANLALRLLQNEESLKKSTHNSFLILALSGLNLSLQEQAKELLSDPCVQASFQEEIEMVYQDWKSETKG